MQKVMSPFSPGKDRGIGFDILRAIAIIMVLVFHVTTIPYFENNLGPAAQLFRQYGSFGVDIFFPLSGFLVCQYLLRMPASNGVTIFFLRRVFRIIPIYLVAVLAFYVGLKLFDGAENEIQNIWKPMTLLTGWFIFFESRDVIPYTITWSISVEEFAYIVFGMSALFGRRILILSLVFFSVAPLVIRWLLIKQGYSDVYFFPPARIDSIAIGGVCAYLYSVNQFKFKYIFIITVCVVALTIMIDGARHSMLYTCISLGTCSIISVIINKKHEKNSFVVKLFASIGFLSYFIYLFHYMFIEAIFITGNKYGVEIPYFWMFVGMALASTYIAAYISYILFEGPIMRWARKLEPSLSRKTS